MTRKKRILIVDSDREQTNELLRAFEDLDFLVDVERTLTAARDRLLVEIPDALLVETELPDGSGADLFCDERLKQEGVVFLAMARDPDVHTVVEAMKRGAADVIEKPVFGAHAAAIVAKKLPERPRSAPSATPPTPDHLTRPPIIGDSPALSKLLASLEPVTRAPRATVLIEGESGTGKELIARAIHYDGPRSKRPFLAINCATLTENLLEAQHFGYDPGAFTGASTTGKKGLFESADGGTLFLDEIGELAQSLQAKLLRVLQEGAFKRLGGVADVRCDIRIIAATNRDLRGEVDRGCFRADLYYRLAVVPVAVPPLRERRGDVAELAHHFVETFALDLGKSITGIAPAALERLEAYSWPGNIRELKNVCEYAAIVCDGEVIENRHLTIPDDIERRPVHEDALPLGDRSLKSMESELIRTVLDETRFNITRAADVLGINRSTLYNKMRDYGLQRDDRPKLLHSV